MTRERFDERNTLIIDNDELSVVNHTENALIMSKYDENDATFYKAAEWGMQSDGIMRIIKTDLFTVMNNQFYDIRDELKTSFSNFDQEISGKIRFSSFLKKVDEVQLPDPVEEYRPATREEEIDVGMAVKNRVAWRLFKQDLKK